MVHHQVILQLQSLTHQQKNFLASHGYLRFCSLSKVRPSFQLQSVTSQQKKYLRVASSLSKYITRSGSIQQFPLKYGHSYWTLKDAKGTQKFSDFMYLFQRRISMEEHQHMILGQQLVAF
ncbi:hypothetical protein QQP08_020486 [Theobroma cacao]|nr:hypothetical protein QQP08_020486 [Theobroma cacao]